MEVEIPNNHVILSSNEPSSSSRLGLCEVCAFHEAKYTCPRCEVKTCSLKCNKIHKLEVECDGQSDKAKFIPLNKFTNLDLSNDYRLLEEISRNIEISRKNFGRRFNQDIPGYLLRLRNAAKSRNTVLKFLPYKFARRKSNTTCWDNRSKLIFWHIEWVFVNSDNLKLCSTKVPETEKLSAVLQTYLVKQENEVLQEKLQYYQSAGFSNIQLLLKAEQKVGKKFYELDPNTSVKECLQKKLVIEYPTIHVVLRDHAFAYNIIDSDHEDENINDELSVKTGQQVIETIITNSENDDNLYASLKNLLFISEYSDEELSE